MRADSTGADEAELVTRWVTITPPPCDRRCGIAARATFAALKHVFITFTEEGFTNIGPTQILGGTGDYAGIVGHGVNVGATEGATGGDSITGWVREHP